MTKNSALQEAIDRVYAFTKSPDKLTTTFMGDLQKICSAAQRAETAEKRIAELERIDRNSIHQYRILTTQNTTLRNKIKELKAMMPEVVTAEKWFKFYEQAEKNVWNDHLRKIDNGGMRNEIGLAIHKLFPNGLRIIKGDE